jgi:ankyrin repeat protein
LFLLAALGSAPAQEVRLVQAVRDGAPLDSIQALLAKGTPVDQALPDGSTALAWAAHRDNLEAATLLLRAGANANAANDYGVTPLALACLNRSTAMVATLLKGGANPNAAQRTGETPLIVCAWTGAADAVIQLLKAGADVNAKETQQGQTALMRAAAGKHPRVIEALVAHGADVHARSRGGFTALLFASQQGDVASARILLEAGAGIEEAPLADEDARRDEVGGPCVSERDVCFLPRENGTPLLIAAASGHEELALFLLDKGANPNAIDAYGRTALHYAIPEGWAGIDAFYYRPFHEKTRLPNLPALVKALLARGANPNARIARDFSPYRWGPYAIITSAAGATPFAFAAAAADLELMKLLLEAGADPHLPLKDGTTALMLAAGVGRIQDRWTRQEEANALEAVKLLAALGLDVNAANKSGDTALHGAANVSGDPIIEFLAAIARKRAALTPAPWSCW